MSNISDPFIVDATDRLRALEAELTMLMERRKQIDMQMSALRSYLEAEKILSLTKQAEHYIHHSHTRAFAVKESIPEQYTLSSYTRKPSVKEQVIEATEKILADGMPHRTEALVAMLTKLGISIGGEDKVATVSSILSREKHLFRANRRVGWSLTKNESLATNEASEPPTTQ